MHTHPEANSSVKRAQFEYLIFFIISQLYVSKKYYISKIAYRKKLVLFTELDLRRAQHKYTHLKPHQYHLIFPYALRKPSHSD